MIDVLMLAVLVTAVAACWQLALACRALLER